MLFFEWDVCLLSFFIFILPFYDKTHFTDVLALVSHGTLWTSIAVADIKLILAFYDTIAFDIDVFGFYYALNCCC